MKNEEQLKEEFLKMTDTVIKFFGKEGEEE